jgi:hypothetical protein
MRSRALSAHPAPSRPLVALVLFLAGHVVLALLMKSMPPIATLHALGVLAAGLYLAATRPPRQVAWAAAYIAGAEVLWRMTNAAPVWEFGKYATILVFTVSLLRQREAARPILPLLYFVLLMPSAVLTMFDLPFEDARRQISFNLSGPLAVSLALVFFSRLSLTRVEVRRLFLCIIAPAISIATLATVGIVTAAHLEFTTESNVATSGGFGPVQVSAVLGLGALLSLLGAVDRGSGAASRAVLLACALGLAVQSSLTFSRAGLFNAAGAAAAALFYLLRDAHSRVQAVALVSLFVLAAGLVALPRLDDLTGGKLSERFSDAHLTGRDEIAQADLRVWKDHPVVGVGPGGAKRYRLLPKGPVAAHTEVTRALAEHGLFGLGSLVVLAVISVQNIRRAGTLAAKSIAAAALAWSLLFTLGDALRIVAPALMMGLSAALLVPEERPARPVTIRPRRSWASLPAATTR